MVKIKKHKHQCSNKKCGFIWQHAQPKRGTRRIAHTCKKCGTLQFIKYRPVKVIRNFETVQQAITWIINVSKYPHIQDGKYRIEAPKSMIQKTVKGL